MRLLPRPAARAAPPSGWTRPRRLRWCRARSANRSSLHPRPGPRPGPLRRRARGVGLPSCDSWRAWWPSCRLRVWSCARALRTWVGSRRLLACLGAMGAGAAGGLCPAGSWKNSRRWGAFVRAVGRKALRAHDGAPHHLTGSASVRWWWVRTRQSAPLPDRFGFCQVVGRVSHAEGAFSRQNPPLSDRFGFCQIVVDLVI